ncbi:hypothetical protein NDU88_002002 [Pleurodeles waltl]|uniref:Uncharacterized protein n=1 Tax=Pleurodeles waltl TaxID=8319 RepID=A0AAV7VDA5_PLEWA|nr:hypothetical protein NDU88_002002 [Pleurodeles waltl]
MEANKVVQALKVLQEAGREDLIKEGVLEQAWVGLKRPKSPSSDRVSAAVLACKSLVSSPKKGKKFKAKSVAGRKVSFSLERECEELRVTSLGGLPGVSAVRRIGACFPRRSGASLRQRVAAAGRGAFLESAHGGAGQTLERGFRARALSGLRRPQAAMRTCGQMGEIVAHASIAKRACAHKGLVREAPLALERQLGGAANMAAPSELGEVMVDETVFETGEDMHRNLTEQVFQDIIIIDSEEEGELVEVHGQGIIENNGQLGRGLVVQSGGLGRQIPKTVTQVVQGVQEWEVANQAVFRTGGQVFFRDEQGLVLKGTICGLASEGYRTGPAQVRREICDHEQRAYLPGCVAPLVSSGHGVAVEHQRSGRPAECPFSVGVRAPPGRRLEERGQSGAVRPTSREVVSLEARSLDQSNRVREPQWDSRSAILGGNEEEGLDYVVETLGLVTRWLQFLKHPRVGWHSRAIGCLGERLLLIYLEVASVVLRDAVSFGSLGIPLCVGQKNRRRPGILGSSWGWMGRGLKYWFSKGNEDGFVADQGTLGWHAYCVDLFGTS